MLIYSKKKTGVYLYSKKKLVYIYIIKLIYSNVGYSKSNSAVRGNP